jgi:CHAT domain-containing protein
LWGRAFVVLDWSQQGRLAECLAEIDRLQAVVDQQGYSVLSGTVRNRRGQILGRQGNQEGAIRERLDAIRYFERAADVDQLAVMHSMLAEAYRFLGDTRSAWTHHGEALNRLANTPNHRSRHLVFVQAGLTATLEGQFDAAIAFQRQVVVNGREWRRASGTATGYLHQARNAFRLGLLDQADVAIGEARALAGQIPDTAFRDRIELELLEAEGEVFGSREPAAGLPMLTTAVERFTKQGFAVRQANLLLWRGRLHERASDTAAAEADWQRALLALEAERATVSAESLRLAQAGGLRALYNEMALTRVRHGSGAAESLAPLERGRARTLVEHALGVARPAADLRDLQQQLDAHTGVVHYAIGDTDAVAWLTTRDAILAVRLPVTAGALRVLTDRYRRLTPRSRDAALASSRELYRVLLAPLGASLGSLSSLVVVPDPALAGVSFSALNDPATGSYLIESKSVAMAPSATLVAEPAAHASASNVLLIGADRPEGAAPLRWVANELTRLQKVYGGATVLTGRDATREQLLAEAPRASVIHFAGHAFGNPTNPLLSRLVLHRGAGDRSDLYAFELGSLDVSGATVVLAACQTGYAGAGTQDDDGVLAMARPFLARGARAVLATYRDVSDSGAPALMEQFHRHLKSGKTPSQAWQATAVDAIRAPDGSSEWTAYAVFLGRGSLDPARVRPVTNDTSGGR